MYERKIKSQRRESSRNREKGFSLIELLVALAIMAVLVTLVGPRLFNQVDRSKVSTARRASKVAENVPRRVAARYGAVSDGGGRA